MGDQKQENKCVHSKFNFCKYERNDEGKAFTGKLGES